MTVLVGQWELHCAYEKFCSVVTGSPASASVHLGLMALYKFYFCHLNYLSHTRAGVCVCMCVYVSKIKRKRLTALAH